MEKESLNGKVVEFNRWSSINYVNDPEHVEIFLKSSVAYMNNLLNARGFISPEMVLRDGLGLNYDADELESLSFLRYEVGKKLNIRICSPKEPSYGDPYILKIVYEEEKKDG